MRAWFWGSVAAYFMVWAYAAAVLPERVPVHFGPLGEADRFASRTEALVTLGLVGLGTALTFVLVDFLLRRGDMSMLNIPHKQWWTAAEQRRDRARVLMRDDMHVFGAATMLLLVVVAASTVVAAQADEPRLGWGFFVALFAYLVFTGVWLVRMHGAYHPRRHSDLEQD